MPIDDPDARFAIGPSTIAGAGNGLFARLPLATGDRLEVIGVLVQADSTSDRCTHFADAYKVRVGNLLLIPLGYAALVNHSPCPNVEKVIEGEKVYLRALRDISPGEEVLFTYSDYARDRFGLD
jgi:hypothetical protein